MFAYQDIEAKEEPAAEHYCTFKRKYYRKWPHCANIKCVANGTSKASMEAMCKSYSNCTGFSFSTNVSKGSGCLKKCGISEFGRFGANTHDYWVKECVKTSPPTKGRCGPLFSNRKCNCSGWEIYCNTDNGWCGNTAAHKNAQAGSQFDCPPTKVPTKAPTKTPSYAPTAAPPVCDFKFYPYLDSNLNNIGHYTGGVQNYSKLCLAKPKCTCFNSNGWLKYKTRPINQWYKWNTNPKLGLYMEIL